MALRVLLTMYNVCIMPIMSIYKEGQVMKQSTSHYEFKTFDLASDIRTQV